MNVSKIVVGVAVCALSSQLSWGQAVRTAAQRPMDVETMAAASTQTGTFVVNFNITVKSALPATAPISCEVDAIMTEISGGGVNITSESATVAATRSGNTAKCTVTIPYSWTVVNPATAVVGLSYGITAGKIPPPATGLQNRTSVGSIGSFPVPASGSTTTQTINPVI